MQTPMRCPCEVDKLLGNLDRPHLMPVTQAQGFERHMKRMVQHYSKQDIIVLLNVASREFRINIADYSIGNFCMLGSLIKQHLDMRRPTEMPSALRRFCALLCRTPCWKPPLRRKQAKIREADTAGQWGPVQAVPHEPMQPAKVPGKPWKDYVVKPRGMGTAGEQPTAHPVLQSESPEETLPQEPRHAGARAPKVKPTSIPAPDGPRASPLPPLSPRRSTSRGSHRRPTHGHGKKVTRCSSQHRGVGPSV
eukprot:TRINITY_DN7850_c0_g1_i1.p2 TRINITY_DN7850_c0_g1~~TRINITY_DN7850_c0_g1_i1.p2  ORF type:complete len:250 (+),score=46.28 TRINITY_DN7850_c0_g1_i1:450-1199(+)